ncbi:uncharacterized protein [Dermacentor andersoni]|uniref:uncharacterized protein isoform X2 n=1 Tax=Dermacentor andersoni TaxID=34620 RepID=UPI002416177B|nr:uncharacterized protein LOC129383813 isoform X3 [Dermacentor andersoni]
MASCPLSVILVCACATLAGEFAAGRQIEVTPDDERAPLHDILFRQNSAPAPRQYGPIQRFGVDHHCVHNSDCASDLCCRVDNVNVRTCQPRSKTGENCVPDVPYSGHYNYYCPCLKGFCMDVTADYGICRVNLSQG